MEKTQKSLASLARLGESTTPSAFHYAVIILSSVCLLIKLDFAAPCSKAMQCVSIAWRTSEQPLTVRSPSEKDPSITGRLTRTESLTLDLDQ